MIYYEFYYELLGISFKWAKKSIQPVIEEQTAPIIGGM